MGKTNEEIVYGESLYLRTKSEPKNTKGQLHEKFL